MRTTNLLVFSCGGSVEFTWLKIKKGKILPESISKKISFRTLATYLTFSVFLTDCNLCSVPNQWNLWLAIMFSDRLKKHFWAKSVYFCRSSLIRVYSCLPFRLHLLCALLNFFFVILVLRPIKIISFILSWVNGKVRQKREIPEKNHSQAEPGLSHVTRAGLEPPAVRWRAI